MRPPGGPQDPKNADAAKKLEGAFEKLLRVEREVEEAEKRKADKLQKVLDLEKAGLDLKDRQVKGLEDAARANREALDSSQRTAGGIRSFGSILGQLLRGNVLGAIEGIAGAVGQMGARRVALQEREAGEARKGVEKEKKDFAAKIAPPKQPGAPADAPAAGQALPAAAAPRRVQPPVLPPIPPPLPPTVPMPGLPAPYKLQPTPYGLAPPVALPGQAPAPAPSRPTAPTPRVIPPPTPVAAGAAKAAAGAGGGSAAALAPVASGLGGAAGGAGAAGAAGAMGGLAGAAMAAAGPIGAVAAVLGVLKDATISLGGAASPVALQRFQMAVDDTAATLGRIFVPVLELFTDGVRLAGDVLASILPTTSEMREALAPFRDALGDLRDAFATMAPVLRPLIKGLLEIQAVLWKVGVFLMTWPIQLAKLLGLIDKDAKLDSSRGAATRPAQIGDISSYINRAYTQAYSQGKEGTPSTEKGWLQRISEAVDKILKVIDIPGKAAEKVGEFASNASGFDNYVWAAQNIRTALGLSP